MISSDLRNWETDICEAVAKAEYVALELIAALHFAEGEPSAMATSWKRFQSRTWTTNDSCLVGVTFHVEHNPSRKYFVRIQMIKIWDVVNGMRWLPLTVTGYVPGKRETLGITFANVLYYGEMNPIGLDIDPDMKENYPYRHHD